MNAIGTPPRNTVLSCLGGFVVTDRLHWLTSLKAPLAAGPRKGRCGIVVRTNEYAEVREHLVTPDEIRKRVVEAAPLIRDEPIASADLALDVGQNLSSLLVKAQRTRRAGKSLTVKVPLQIVDRCRPRATHPPNRLTDANHSRVRAALKRNLLLSHGSGHLRHLPG
jgi:hypothetical protein